MVITHPVARAIGKEFLYPPWIHSANFRLTDLCFADDICLVATSQRVTQKLLHNGNTKAVTQYPMHGSQVRSSLNIDLDIHVLNLATGTLGAAAVKSHKGQISGHHHQ